ncbi:MAG: MFS transporter, partial [Vicinamibacterales bacterium]
APPALGPAGAVAWFTVTMAAGFLAWTTVQIPNAALGPELETGHHERTALFAVRDGLWMAGTLVAAAMPALLRAVLPDGAGERAVFGWMGAIYGSLIVALAWGAVAVLRERPPAARTTAPAPPWRVAREALANRPFRILLAAYAIGALGGALPGTLIFFFVEHVLAAPELGDLFLALYFLVGFACLPAWTWLARRVGKKPAFLAAMGLSVAVFSAAFLLGPGDTLAYGAVVVLSGTGFGAGLVLPASMQADTLDLDELRSGARREGVYLGLWSVVMKSSAAIGAGAGLTVLGWAGYAGTGTPPEPALLAIRVLYCLVPCACYLAALVVAARYPLDEAACRRIRDELDARNTRPPQAAPVA